MTASIVRFPIEKAKRSSAYIHSWVGWNRRRRLRKDASPDRLDQYSVDGQNVINEFYRNKMKEQEKTESEIREQFALAEQKLRQQAQQDMENSLLRGELLQNSSLANSSFNQQFTNSLSGKKPWDLDI